MRRGRKLGAEHLAGLRLALRRPSLDERWRLVAARVVAGETYTRIGSEIGVTRQRVEQIVHLMVNSEDGRPRRRGRPRRPELPQAGVTG